MHTYGCKVLKWYTLLTYAHTVYLTADPDRRLLLLYLANDILQNGRRRGTDVFQELFKDPLREAAILARWVLTTCSNTHKTLLTTNSYIAPSLGSSDAFVHRYMTRNHISMVCSRAIGYLSSRVMSPQVAVETMMCTICPLQGGEDTYVCSANVPDLEGEEGV